MLYIYVSVYACIHVSMCMHAYVYVYILACLPFINEVLNNQLQVLLKPVILLRFSLHALKKWLFKFLFHSILQSYFSICVYSLLFLALLLWFCLEVLKSKGVFLIWTLKTLICEIPASKCICFFTAFMRNFWVVFPLCNLTTFNRSSSPGGA